INSIPFFEASLAIVGKSIFPEVAMEYFEWRWRSVLIFIYLPFPEALIMGLVLSNAFLPYITQVFFGWFDFLDLLLFFFLQLFKDAFHFLSFLLKGFSIYLDIEQFADYFQKGLSAFRIHQISWS